MQTVQELLSNEDIEYYCKSLKIPLIEILNKNLFNNIKPKKGAYVINLQNAGVGPGTHWTALIITNAYAIYYDSFGGHIPKDILKFIRRYSKLIKIIYSIDQIQQIDSIFCGWFCVYFLYFFTVQHKKCTNYKH